MKDNRGRIRDEHGKICQTLSFRVLPLTKGFEMIQKRICLAWVIWYLTFLPMMAAAQVNMGEVYYDFGVFAYEDRDYEGALKNFETALKFSPDNPYYHQFKGKTLYELARYDEALASLKQAEALDPAIADLKNDIALTHFTLGNYLESSLLYSEISAQKPSDALSHYRAGISFFKLENYEEALGFLLNASEKSPSIKPNGYYHAAVCYYKTGGIDKAVEYFEYVRDRSGDETLARNASVWLEQIATVRKAQKPYQLYLNAGREYDDNVRLLPDDVDIGADEEDWLTSAFFSGRYNFSNNKGLIFRTEYDHYQSWYDEVDEYDMTISMFILGPIYLRPPFSFGFSYLPSLYWVDGEDYLNQHQFKPDITWQIRDDLIAGISYRYSMNDYQDDDFKDGHTNEVSLNTEYRFLDGEGGAYVSLTYEDFSASHPDEYYTRLKALASLSLKIFWDIDLGMQVRYSDKKHDHVDSVYGIERNDDRYGGQIAISRNIYKWLNGGFKFDYSKNDSNILSYEYERRIYSLFLSVDF
jgi:tetratricopeptide (TPR) repeat protein